MAAAAASAATSPSRRVASQPAAKHVDASGPEATSWLHIATDIEIKVTDAPPALRHIAFTAARQAMRRKASGALNHDHEVAREVAATLAGEEKGSWHVIVGSSFGSFVSHEVGTKMLFFIGGTGFLVFRHG
jgi:dynein light chain LC8-type